MSSLLKNVNLTKRCLEKHTVLCTVVRNHWNKDFRPATVPPKSEKDKVEAANKYGLLPQDYRPFPDDGFGYGDYPNIPPESADSRDPFYPWDNPELKRNFNEVLHYQADLISENRYDVNARHRKPGWRQWTEFIGTLAFLFSIYYWLDDKRQFLPLTPKQYPGCGKHYTFEPAKEC